MIDTKTADKELQTYIRPQTFPVAIRMLKPGEPIPERARRPARDFKKLSMSCQVIDMSRRYGWMIALTREDHICSLGITAIGFDKPLPIYNVGTLCEGMYTETKEAGQRSEAAIDKFSPGEYETLLVAPLDRATFEPHVVCIYANPAQVMRLTQAALWKRGGRLASSFEGRAVCADTIVASFAGTLDGLSIEEYCTNPIKAITAMMNYYERYQPDVVLAYNDLAKEAEAFGCKVKYSDYVVPSIEGHVLEDKANLAALRMPDPYKTARLPGFIEQCEALVKAAPPAAMGAVAVGPWTIAMLLRNPEMMLLDTFEDPQFIHDLMRVTTDFCKVWGDAIVKTKIGLSFSEPTASISLVSPDNYRDFIAPYHKELVDYFKAKKVGLTTHICGTTYPIFEDIIGCGFTTVSFDLDQQADPKLHVDQLERFVEVAKGRAVAIGNVDATRFEKTTKEEMEADVRRCIDAAAKHSGFILSTSCEIPPRSNPEIVKWFMDSAHDFGRYERILG